MQIIQFDRLMTSLIVSETQNTCHLDLCEVYFHVLLDEVNSQIKTIRNLLSECQKNLELCFRRL
jgi:hypothetical protein